MSNAQKVMERSALIEDVEFLLGVGESRFNIAKRVGCSSQTLERRLVRAGRNDLARAVHIEVPS